MRSEATLHVEETPDDLSESESWILTSETELAGGAARSLSGSSASWLCFLGRGLGPVLPYRSSLLGTRGPTGVPQSSPHSSERDSTRTRRKRKFRRTARPQGCVCTEERPREDTARRQHLQARERGLRRDHSCRHLDLGLQPPDCEKTSPPPILSSTQSSGLQSSLKALTGLWCRVEEGGSRNSRTREVSLTPSVSQDEVGTCRSCHGLLQSKEVPLSAPLPGPAPPPPETSWGIFPIRPTGSRVLDRSFGTIRFQKNTSSCSAGSKVSCPWGEGLTASPGWSWRPAFLCERAEGRLGVCFDQRGSRVSDSLTLTPSVLGQM
ncbi:uncharacterized protein LOC131417968 [Diceros bicornis minor]|uniref:uncharacterized protein LOC131417968 n=1 Tax=Diceros bicornis minor TaxID=77932 RepID=UPI0026EA033C|nr:uncharacterized protein LOC131417968 [Diceros bicornis minor]